MDVVIDDQIEERDAFSVEWNDSTEYINALKINQSRAAWEGFKQPNITQPMPFHCVSVL